MIEALHTALSGLTAFARGVQTAAHNVANMGTPGFKRDRSEARETQNGGVQVSTSTDPHPGPRVFRETAPELALEEQSNVDIGEELVSLSLAQRAFDSNASVVTTTDRMLGSLLNIRK